MRHFRLLLTLICASFLLGCGSTGGGKPVQLTVLTYNIHHAAGMDQKLDVERIAGVIKRCNPDLVALQEVDNGTIRTKKVDQAAELGKILGMNVVYGKAMDYEGGQYGNAVLSKPSIKHHRVINLPFTGGKHEPRAALVATVRTAGGDVLFASTHLDHLSEPSDRPAQMKAIVKGLEGETLPIILAGDFNCKPGSEPLAALDEAWMRATDDAPSIPVVTPRAKIDHVFVKPVARWKVIETYVMDEQVASDHRPVVAKVELLLSE